VTATRLPVLLPLLLLLLLLLPFSFDSGTSIINLVAIWLTVFHVAVSAAVYNAESDPYSLRIAWSPINVNVKRRRGGLCAVLLLILILLVSSSIALIASASSTAQSLIEILVRSSGVLLWPGTMSCPLNG